MLTGEKIKLVLGFGPLRSLYTEVENSLSDSCTIALPDLLSGSKQASHGSVWPRQRGGGGAKN